VHLIHASVDKTVGHTVVPLLHIRWLKWRTALLINDVLTLVALHDIVR